MGLLEDVLDGTTELESPPQFWYWSALAAISAVSKNVFLNRGGAYNLYPNIYVILEGKTGIRKGPPVKLARKLVELCESTRTITGRNSIQAIISEAGKAKTFKDGRILTDASSFVVSDEFSNLIVDDPQSQTILTQLYDSNYHDDWTNTMKYGGVDVLKKPYFVLLGATNKTHFDECIQAKSITGGFIGRTMVIHAEKRNKLNSLTKPMQSTIDIPKIFKRLKEISLLTGEFTMSPEAITVFDDWYYDFNKKLEENNEDATGTSDRLPDHALKVAILLSLSEKNELIITEKNMTTAIDSCVLMMNTVKRITTGKGISEYSAKSSKVIEALINSENRTLERSRLLRKVYGDVDVFDLDRISEHLEQSGIMKVNRDMTKGVHYTLTDAAAEYFGVMLKRRK